MTAMRDADGTVIGAGGSGRHLCTKSSYERRRFNCQTKATDALSSDRIPVCPKAQAFRDRTCEITADGRTIGKKVGDQTMLTSRDRQIVNDSLRKHGLKLGMDGAAMPLEGNPPGGVVDADKLRGILSELGIMEDDIETLIARLNEPDGNDAAPSNMGKSTSESAFGGGSSGQGGGEMRSYAPTDPSPMPENNPYASDHRGRRMAGDAARRQRQYAADTKSFEARFPDATRIGA